MPLPNKRPPGSWRNTRNSITVQLGPELRRDIEAAALADKRTLSDWTRLSLERAVAQARRQGAAR